MDGDNERTSSNENPDNTDNDEDQWEYYDDATTLTDLWHVSMKEH